MPATTNSVVEKGEPDLSFRYAETFGETRRAYPADTAYLNGPNGLFIDGGDNLYLAEELGARILKYDATSNHLLSIGIAGFQNRGETTFNQPQDVAVDGSGKIWTVDRHRVAQYDTNGDFIQEFPSEDPWNVGNDNSHFDGPKGIAFDSSGRMYVADSYNHRVQVYEFDVDGRPVYSTTLGVTDNPGSDNTHFNKPAQIVIDSSDRLYITDVDNARVQRCVYTDSWTCTTFHGTGSTGSGIDELNLAYGIGIDTTDNVYIADGGNGRIKRCDTSGTCSVLASDVGWTADVAIDSGGNLYVSHFFEHVIREYESNGTPSDVFKGAPGTPYLTDDGYFNEPYGIAIDASGNLLLSEYSGFRLVKLNAEGNAQWAVGEPGVYGDDNLHFGGIWDGPASVAVDSDGNAYVADTDNHRVQKCTSSGSCTTFAGITGETGTDNEHFDDPFGVALDSRGNVYVAEQDNHRVQKCTPTGVCTTFAGVTATSGSGDNHFDGPMGVAVDDSGNVYVADSWNRRVQKCTPSGSCTTFAGTTDVWGDDFDSFSEPHDVAIDGQGRVYVADAYNQRVQVFDDTGAYLTTIGGRWGDATGQLRQPHGVAVDAQGNVYITDGINHRVQKFVPGVPNWKQVNINGFGNPTNTCADTFAVFEDDLYVGTNNDGGTGGEIWRYDAPTWTAVITPGFGTPQNQHVRGLTVFDGYLYVGTTNKDAGAQIWRSGDGENWTRVASNGIDDTNNFEINQMVVFSDTLYVSTTNDTTSAELWRSASGNAGSWTQVNADGFNDPANAGIWLMKVFDGQLYVGTNNTTDGGEIWRSPDGTNWTNITEGFGDSNNVWVHALAIFENQIYASTGNWADGGEIWRSSTGDAGDWSQVVDGGFDEPQNNVVARLAAVHDGYLYASTANWSTGQEVWRTQDGITWQQVNVDGFGDSNNFDPFWSDASVVYNGSLYVGTCNEANGGEVWQRLHRIYLPLVLRQ